MIAFVKSIRDFSTLAAAQVVSWDLPLATSGDDTGSVVLLGESAAGREGNWLVIDRRVYLISQTAYSKGLTTLTLQMPVNAFDRGIYYASPGTSIEAFIAAALTSAYKSISDSYFAMPYLDITADSTTAFTAPELSDGMYVLSDYIKSVRSSKYTTEGAVDVPGVICDFSCTDTTLNIRLHNTAPVTRKAVFDTSLFQLKTRACSRDITSKVSVINPETGANTDFYLSAWGQAVTTPPSDRIEGKWVSVAYNGNEAAIDTARKEFENNQDTHKVEFYSKLQFGLLDPITMRMGDAVETYQITCIRKSSADDRYLYTCGDLPTTLTDKIKQLGNISRTMTGATRYAGASSVNGETAVDYIVEEGTANNWNYRKWNSGWAECWRTLSISNYKCNTAVGSWYRTAELTSAAYPFTFTATPNLQMFFETATGTSGLIWSAGADSDDDDKSRPHKFYVIRMLSSDAISGKVHMKAIGKWK